MDSFENALERLRATQQETPTMTEPVRVTVTDLHTGKTKPLGKSPSMKRSCPMWEYMNARLTNRHEDSDRQELMLNSYGRMGWELVAVTLSTNGAHDLNFFFKRRLEGDSPP